MRLRLGLLYGILVALLVIMGVWWVYFLTTENRARTHAELQKLANDRIHAAFLIETDPRVKADPERWLGASFPDLQFIRDADGALTVRVNPDVRRAILDHDRRTRRMFLSEGVFFLVLLAAGSTILVQAWRSEVRFKRSRELFLAGATHEFKTPLASLRLYTETLGRTDLDAAKRDRIQARMLEDVGRLERMVDDILSASAADMFASGHKSTLDLAIECWRVIEDLTDFAAENGAVFRCEGPGGALIRGHRLPLSLALRNLLVNAVQHSPHPVRVTVTIHPGRHRHRILVADNGPGIPRRLQDKVFECFYSTRPGGRDAGAGLGLYLVRRNLDLLGGAVRLDSSQPHGSTFTLELPALRSDAAQDPAPPAAAPEGSRT